MCLAQAAYDPLRDLHPERALKKAVNRILSSLQVQREACEAYVISQRHEGWKALPAAYDDGGFSGGSMERPGLKRLLSDMHAGLIVIIIVYKVDRITRSLTDFAKIVDALDARGASLSR